MNHWMNSAFSLLCAATLGINACQDIPKTKEVEATKAAPPVVQAVKTALPLNCPVMLDSYRREARFVTQDYLIFHIIENPYYDESLGDACKGDMKNLWPDLKRFKSELQTYTPNIQSIRQIAWNIEHFPQTFYEVKNHVNAAVKTYDLHNKLDQVDRSNALGENKLQRELYRFVAETTNSYWIDTHGSIIENALSVNGGVKVVHCSGGLLLSRAV